MKCLVVLCLIYLLIIEDTDAWRRRRRWRRAFRKVVRVGKKVVAAAVLGKRSVTEVMPELNLCDFSSFDHDQNNVISEEEIATFIEITGLTDVDEFFGQIDKNEDGSVNTEEFNTADVILESCSPEQKRR